MSGDRGSGMSVQFLHRKRTLMPHAPVSCKSQPEKLSIHNLPRRADKHSGSSFSTFALHKW